MASDRALRLLLISPLPPPWGGIGKWTHLLRRWGASRTDLRINIVDIAPRFRRGFDKGIPNRILAGLLQGPWDLARILWQLISFNPDVIHLTTSGGLAGFRDYIALAAARLFRVPALYHFRIGSLPEKIRSRSSEGRLLLRAARMADFVLVLDKETLQAVRTRLGVEKVVLIPNAIDLADHDDLSIREPGPGEFSPLHPARGHRVLYIGWMLPEKGLRELIEAWHQVASDDWELVLVGPGPGSFRKELQGLAGSATEIHLYDEVPNAEAQQWMRSADVFVLPSYSEGFPNVILEAMAASKPIIATPVGGISEILDFATSEACGLAVPVGDPKELASKLKELMENHAARQRLGLVARQKVEGHYSTTVVFGRLLALWRGAAGR